MALSKEDKADIAEIVAASIAANAEQAPAVLPNEPVVGGALTAESIAESMTDIMNQKSRETEQRMQNTMFDEKYETLVSQTKGLKEFMEGTDDLGRNRKSQLDTIDDYADKLNALSSLGRSYAEALAGGGGNRAPIVDTELEKKVEDNQSKWEETLTKTYDSVADMQEAAFDQIAAEMASISGA